MMLDDFEAAKHSWDLILEQGGDPISGRYMKSFCESVWGIRTRQWLYTERLWGWKKKEKHPLVMNRLFWQQEKPVWSRRP